MDRLFQILAVVLIGFAAFFLWRGNNDALFASAVLGCVAFFLSIRFQAKARVDQKNAELVEEKYGAGVLENGVNRDVADEANLHSESESPQELK